MRLVLAKAGWHPSEFTVLDRRPFASTARWGAVEMKGEVVSVWNEQWENVRGDVVLYNYSCRRRAWNDTPGGPMTVMVFRLRRETVERFERQRPLSGDVK